MGGCGVQEREVIVADFVDACRRAGFSEIALVPVAYVVPWYRIDDGRWKRWEALAASRRPVRAARKMWLAVLEALGAGKDGPLFEDALGMDLVRLLKASMEHRPLVVATA